MERDEFKAAEPLILIAIPKSSEDPNRDVYNAVRGVSKINPTRAEQFRLVLAHRKGVVVGAFRPTEWLPATTTHFPFLESDMEGRFGFAGVPAESSVQGLYVDRLVPDAYRPRNAANPIRYIKPV
jgi:hypothetical protein